MAARRLWRPGETGIDWIEQAFDASKSWQLLQALKPSYDYRQAYEAEVFFVPTRAELEARGSLWLRAHEEEGNNQFVSLYLGTMVVRRAHIGRGHQDPEGGQFIAGPHVHFPTTAFPNIGGKGARSRAYEWRDASPTLRLREVIRLFCLHMNIVGEPSEQQRLTEDS